MSVSKSGVDNMNNSSQPLWHALSQEQVFTFVKSSQAGLDSEEAARRLAVNGVNQLTTAKPRGPIKRFFAQCHNVLIYVLLAAALITALLGHWIDTFVIILVVLVNAAIGFLQEGKAESALLAIKKMLSLQASVLRDGRRVNLPAEQLVVGDIVFLQSGDKVPADLRLLSTKNLQVQEASLTGESLPVEKTTNPVNEDTVLADRTAMVFSSTLVAQGQGKGVVVATANDTEIGHINTLLADVEMLVTPLLRQIAEFGHLLTKVIIIIAGLTLLFGIWVHDNSWSEMFIAAVGLAVAAIPEGLPAIMTITLAIGVQRMVKRQAIIRLLPAVETLGAVTVICSDKTGTLTRNEMTATNIVTASGGIVNVTGEGYDPHGEFLSSDKAVQFQQHPVLTELLRSAILCNDAVLKEHDGDWVTHGDPTEAALLTVGMKAGLNLGGEADAWSRIDTIPFESQHQFMATLHHDHQGHFIAYVKGAPERIFAMCDWQRMREQDTAFDSSYWHNQMDELAKRGQRVLAIACKPFDQQLFELNFSDVEHGLCLLGLVGMIDPPREEATAAIKECQSAGIKVKMITGDHAKTAMAIAGEIGIGRNERVLTGQQLEIMTDTELRTCVNDVDVFARASPEHKLRLVVALQANGHVVAMTGDGVNDAPALKRADVGTAMGINGTEVAKDAAEMVLVDDNFATIVDAVEEGRTVYDNLRKALLFILPTNGGEAFIIITAILLGQVLPITPVQILWVNMITAVTLALALAFEPPERNVMNRPPRDSREAILTPYFIWRILFVSVILLLGTYGLFSWHQLQGVSLDYARTVAVNTLVMFEIFYLFNSRYISEQVLNKRGLLGNRYVLLASGSLVLFQLAFTYLPVMQQLFETTALSVHTWLLIMMVSSSVFFLVELEKYLVRRLKPS